MIEINSKSELTAVLNENKNVIVDFYAEWCGPCRALVPVLEQISGENADVAICKVNVDNNSDLTVEYNITAIPHVFLIQSGEIKNQFKGSLPKNKIVEKINEHLN